MPDVHRLFNKLMIEQFAQAEYTLIFPRRDIVQETYFSGKILKCGFLKFSWNRFSEGVSEIILTLLPVDVNQDVTRGRGGEIDLTFAVCCHFIFPRIRDTLIAGGMSY